MHIQLHLIRKVSDKYVESMPLLSVPATVALRLVGKTAVTGLEPIFGKYIDHINKETTYTAFKRANHLAKLTANIKSSETAYPTGVWVWLAY